LPLFFQRVSAAVFGDAATAWCPNDPTSADEPVPGEGVPADWMAAPAPNCTSTPAYQ